MIDFIGLGAQKSGTSWAYTCLYEHPEVCMPIKEIHFFSRPRYEKGITWYEQHFAACGVGKKKGEWSTSYLYSKETPERIREHYPEVKLLMILRNPIDRAYSQYRNAIRAGEIPKDTTFEAFSEREESVYAQGLYAAQIEHYLKFFKREQMLILIYEDIRKDPVAFMRTIHEFLGIKSDFIASMIHTEVNIARTPTIVGIDRFMHHISEFLRAHRLDRLVHLVRKTGITDIVRSVNTTKESKQATQAFDRNKLAGYFKNDVVRLSALLDRNLCSEWNI